MLKTNKQTNRQKKNHGQTAKEMDVLRTKRTKLLFSCYAEECNVFTPGDVLAIE